MLVLKLTGIQISLKHNVQCYIIFRDLFDPSARVITLVLFVCWPTVTMVYYGISFASEKIHLTQDVFLRLYLSLSFNVISLFTSHCRREGDKLSKLKFHKWQEHFVFYLLAWREI